MIGRPRWSVLPWCWLAALLAAGGGAARAALPPPCEALAGAQRELALGLLASEHPYDCCDGTIAACLQEDPPCRLAWRLAENVCRRAAEGQDAERIRRALSRRARSMLPGGPPAQIDLKDSPAAGAADAPVQIAVYACARCPFCSRLVPKLHEVVTTGPLKGKARMQLRVFPIRDHEFSKEGGLAFLAAERQGRLWEFVLHAYANFDRFRVEDLPAWAEAVGMKRDVFERDMADPVLRDALVESKKEGLRNEVEVTPTVFLDGRKFLGDVTLEEIVDAAGEEYDNRKGETTGRP